MNIRRTAIEKLCHSFLTRQNANIEECRDMYKHLMRPMVDVESLPNKDISDFIESIGCQLFSDRPANMAYVMVFLEFVLQMYESVGNGSIDLFVASAANVIEKSTFDPIPDGHVLFRNIISVLVNVFALIIHLF